MCQKFNVSLFLLVRLHQYLISAVLIPLTRPSVGYLYVNVAPPAAPPYYYELDILPNTHISAGYDERVVALTVATNLHPSGFIKDRVLLGIESIHTI